MTCIVFDVDSQKDFMNSDGGLYVPGAEDIKKAINSVLLIADKHDVDIYGSVDAHSAEDDEFKSFPEHCVVNTDGQQKIPESIISHVDNVYYVPNTGNGVDMSLFGGSRQVYFEKQTYNVWDRNLGQPDNIQTLLRMSDVSDVYVVGVATDICVLAAVKGFLNRQYKVTVIEDAIAGLDNSDIAKDEMKSLGARFITVDEFAVEIEKRVVYGL